MDKQQLSDDFQSVKRLKVITSRKTHSGHREPSVIMLTLLVAFLTSMLPTSNCKFQQQDLDRNIWHSWKTKRSKRCNRLHERGNLSVMKWSNWKEQKLCISNDIEAMHKSADNYADKAEKSHDLTYIAKSNSLRRAAKDKAAELKSVSDQLEAACLAYNSRTVKLGRWLLLYWTTDVNMRQSK